MIQRFILPLLFCSLQLIVTAQKVATSITYSTQIPNAGIQLIAYDPAIQLTIADFKGAPNESSLAAAITNTGFSFSAGYSKKDGAIQLNIVVYCSFNRDLSWMKEKSKTAYILAHEQRHYDICYLSTMKFLQQLRKTTFKEDDYREQLQQLYNKAIEEMTTEQEQYDSETSHGIFTKIQEEWNAKIITQMNALKVDW